MVYPYCRSVTEGGSFLRNEKGPPIVQIGSPFEIAARCAPYPGLLAGLPWAGGLKGIARDRARQQRFQNVTL